MEPQQSTVRQKLNFQKKSIEFARVDSQASSFSSGTESISTSSIKNSDYSSSAEYFSDGDDEYNKIKEEAR